jgi:hypothetical protein
MEDKVVTIGSENYVLKMFPALTGLKLMNKLEHTVRTTGTMMDDALVFEVISKGCSLGSVNFTEAKFNSHFKGKYKEIYELFAEVLKHNNMFPEESEGNEQDSEE